ncbi:hypothetical protein MATR_37250 [Marivirga tractuosa]|uniref:GPI inositol-deacylase PGAP1-like alpha/beta domain-containing protein n=1 Tax=Marivirga tractuosa (strain ATCC 23168 / DSM 4126 / NBRC 15989 / NCIMB 1408 / VKM B-1430 / H-43) TaxID=643867 RepID=E4TN15_MARTH|nr:hypothetical protein [Marivirga tractuosa]ADR22429.1 hypothetical protein Ftrac_2451 [Marivirga tractuosa DSM 4126]BDD16900.1 hypothetical protein MATR_37250 [Marivirga tractuosa]
MKSFYLSALLLMLCMQSFGQTDQKRFTPEKSRYIQKMDSVFEDLDKTKISTGILYDRVPSFANIEQFNKAYDTANFNLFRQAWSELYRASYTPDFMNLPEKINSMKKKDDYDQISIGLINMEFNTINKGKGQEEKGFQMRNGKLAPVEGKALYKKETLVMLAPLKERVWGQDITFKFDEDFWLQETEQPIENLSADFGDGNWHTLVNRGQKTMSELSVNYEESGSKLLRFQVTLQNGIQYTTQSTMDVQQTSSARADPLVEDNNIEANIAFKGYNESVAIKGKNDYRTFYRTKDGNTTPNLQKPIIILDGFDPLDERKIDENDEGHEAPESILQLMEYGSEDNNLVPTLRDEGYDVIIVNHSSYEADETGETIVAGGDFIERNAMVLIALIQRVNTELANNGSTEELVVVGPSMGGLISRYALAYMEKHSMDHNTRLWVSFDSPHLGANIPIGISQALHFFAYTGGQENARESYEEKLTSTAAKQMLIEQYYGVNNQKLNNTAGFRQQFINSLEGNGLRGSNGFPVNLRKVSLLNGTTLGKRNNSLGEKFLDLKGKKLGVKVAEVMTNFMTAHNTQTRTFKGVVTDYSLWLPGLGVDGIEVETSNANPNGSMDVTAGAYHNTGEIMHNDFLEGFNDANLNITTDYHLPNHTFIPTVSALALENANFNWSNSLNRNLVCTGETPFDSYYAPNENQQHIYPTTENVAWIMAEINGNEQTPIVRLTGDDLTGSDFVCDQNTTYSFENCKLGSGVSSWSTSSSLQIVSSNANSITVNPSANSQSNNSITAYFNDGTSVTKNVWVGTPANILQPDDLEGPECIKRGTTGLFHGLPWPTYVPGATEYEPQIVLGGNSSGFTFWSDVNRVYVEVTVAQSVPDGYYVLQILPKNSCGYADGVFAGFNVSGSKFCSPVSIMLYPNPTADELTVEWEEEPVSKSKQNFEYQLTIVSEEDGSVVHDKCHRKIKEKINMRAMKAGYYRVRVNYQDEHYSYRILKQ